MWRACVCQIADGKWCARALEGPRHLRYDALSTLCYEREFALVNRNRLFAALVFACSVPLAAAAATVSPSSIPDGTYTVTVEKVVDAKHVQVKMDNGSDTTLSAGKATVDFSKVQPNDQLKLSVIAGAVAVFMDLTTH